jgi:hypothetical protein
MDYRASLVLLVETYARATSRSEARIANLAGRDSRFFERMRAGKTCSVDTLHHVLGWFSQNWPSDVAWPVGITRPANTEDGPATQISDESPEAA